MIYEECVKKWRKSKERDVLDRFFQKFTYSSNKINNEETKLGDVENIFEGIDINILNTSEKTIREIKNHKELCDFILKLTKDNNSELSIALIKRFHYILMKGYFGEELLMNGEKPGEFTNNQYIEGIDNIQVCPLKVEENLRFLVDKINNIQINEDNAIRTVSYFQCFFHRIHPFYIGNRRIAMMILNYLLIKNDLPPIIVFYYDRKEYYQALDHFSKTQEISRMVEFLENQAYKTWLKNYNLKLKSLKDF